MTNLLIFFLITLAFICGFLWREIYDRAREWQLRRRPGFPGADPTFCIWQEQKNGSYVCTCGHRDPAPAPAHNPFRFPRRTQCPECRKLIIFRG